MIPADQLEAYALGLWCADGYWWSSSVGLTNVDTQLIQRFATFLTSVLPSSRLKLRVYTDDPSKIPRVMRELSEKYTIARPYKMKQIAYQVYVNSRPLLREFQAARAELHARMDARFLGAYFAGRVDGDGVLGATPRICYTTGEEADVDQELMARIGVDKTSIYKYGAAREYVIYIQRTSLPTFLRSIAPYSLKASRATNKGVG